MPKTSARDTHRISHRKPRQASFSSIHCPDPVQDLWCAGDHHYFDKNQVDHLPKWIENPATGKRTRILAAGWEVLIECGQRSRSHDDGGRPCFASIETLRKKRSANTFRKWRLVWEDEGLLDVRRRPGTGDQPLTNTCRTRNDTEHARRIWNYFPRKAKRNSGEKSYRGTCSSHRQSNNQDTPNEPLTDQKPEQNHGVGQNQSLITYIPPTPELRSVPVTLTAESKPSEEHAWSYREAILNRCRESVELAIVFWLVWKLRALRWSQADFLRYWQYNHTLSGYHSPMAGLQDILVRYLRRGPILDPYPPPDRVVQPLVPMEQSAISIQQSATPAESPPTNPVEKREGRKPANESPPLGALCSPDRVLELLAERGIDNDIGFLAWVPANKRGVWPTDERNVRALIDRYVTSLERNRSSASSDAPSSNRASSPVSGVGAGGSPGESAD